MDCFTAIASISKTYNKAILPHILYSHIVDMMAKQEVTAPARHSVIDLFVQFDKLDIANEDFKKSAAIIFTPNALSPHCTYSGS